MKLGQSLIDKAIKSCGSSAELARKLEMYPADISNLRSGKRALSPEIAAEIAEIAGEDARQAVIDAIIERNMANKKGPILSAILGKGLAVGAVAMLAFFYNDASIAGTATIKNDSKNAQICKTSYTSYLLGLLRWMARLRPQNSRFFMA